MLAPMKIRSIASVALGLLAAACGEPDASVEPAARAPESVEAEPAPPADTEPPAFPDDASTLIANALGRLDDRPRAVTLRWEEADDDVGVVAYVVSIDGEEAARVDAPATQTELADVTFEAARAFAVVAVDEAGNASEALTTSDALAPWFPEDAELGVVDSEAERLTLTWPAAEDDAAVVAYSVERGDEELASLEPDARRYTVPAGERASDLRVVARDAAGHKTRLRGGAALQDARRAVVARDVRARASRMLLGALSSGSGGGLADVLRSGEATRNADSVLSSAPGVGVARGGGLTTAGGGGRGGGGSIGSLRPTGDPPRPASAERAVHGRADVGAPSGPTGAGRLDGAMVTRQFRARRRAFQYCYERALRADPDLAGRISVRFTVAEAGTVTDSTAVADSVGSPDVTACVLRGVRRLRFNPGPEGGPATFTVPLTFAPDR